MEKLRSKPSRTLHTSIICVFELRYGRALRQDFKAFWSRIMNDIISRVTVIQLGKNEAFAAGDILAGLQKTGQKIGVEDIFIASTALTHKCILVMANECHYSRIKDLTIENWLK
ncbi:PIN domain-containing protein [Thermodesulfobacteriota bacterium]